MTINITPLGRQGDTAARSSLTCDLLRAPFPNTLVLVSVLVADNTGTPTEPTDVSGAGLTFSLATSSITYNLIAQASSTHNLSVWKGMGVSPDSSLITATFSNANIGCAMMVNEVSGVTTVGSGGTTAIGGSASSVVDSLVTVTAFLPSAGSTANVWFASHGCGTSGIATALQNWSQLTQTNFLTPSTGLVSAWTTLSTATTSTWTNSATENKAVIALELVSDNFTSVTGWMHNDWARGMRSFAPRVRSVVLEPGRTDATDPYQDTSEG